MGFVRPAFGRTRKSLGVCAVPSAGCPLIAEDFFKKLKNFTAPISDHAQTSFATSASSCQQVIPVLQAFDPI
jgi:hypothetical protein